MTEHGAPKPPVRSYVATTGTTMRLVRARSEAEVRKKIRARAPARRLDDSEILVRLAVADDRRLVEDHPFSGGQARLRWLESIDAPSTTTERTA